MVVVADSGSTKADWRFIGKKETRHAETIGLSPVLHPRETILKELEERLGRHPEVRQVNYYGTGCSMDSGKALMAELLKKIFPNADIAVETDLMGAARAACGKEPGIACILGTGSNSCLYDGEKISDQIPNLGYILGDEGSGNHIGKMLLSAYFYREMPEDLERDMAARLPGGRAYVLEKVYGGSRANAFLASFSTFAGAHRSHPFLQDLLHRAFAEFADRNISKYKNHQSLPVHFTGSIAFHFQEILKITMKKRSIRPGKFIKQPIDFLVKFHSEYE